MKKNKVNGVRVIKGHRKDCTAMKHWPENPLYDTLEIVRCNEAGQRYTHGRGWRVYRCNSASSHPCPAEVWIHGDRLDQFAHEKMCEVLALRKKKALQKRAVKP